MLFKKLSLNVCCEDLSFQGQGIAKINYRNLSTSMQKLADNIAVSKPVLKKKSLDGLTLFVEGLIPGDSAEVYISEIHKNFAFAKIKKMLFPSNLRIPTKQLKTNECAGMPLYNLRYTEQLKFKEKLLQQSLDNFAGINAEKFKKIYKGIVPYRDEEGKEHPLSYRHKMALPCQLIKDNLFFGMYLPKSHKLIQNDLTLLQTPALARIPSLITDFFRKENLNALYRNNDIILHEALSFKALIKHLLVRQSRYTQQIMLCLVLKEKINPNSAVRVFLSLLTDKINESLMNLSENSYRKTPRISSFYLNFHPEDTNLIHSDDFLLLNGDAYIQEQLLNCCFEIGPASFFQINPKQSEILFTSLLKIFDEIKIDRLRTSKIRIFDLYCGVGTIGIILQKNLHQLHRNDISVEEITAVELVAEAADLALKNFNNNRQLSADKKLFADQKVFTDNQKNDTIKYECFAGKVENIVQEKIKLDTEFSNILIVDPPRKGCGHRFLNFVKNLDIDYLIYVSCSPISLAQDIEVLQESFSLLSCELFDMFPHTQHVETVALLSKLDVDKHIDVEIRLDELDCTSVESKVTYAQIK